MCLALTIWPQFYLNHTFLKSKIVLVASNLESMTIIRKLANKNSSKKNKSFTQERTTVKRRFTK